MSDLLRKLLIHNVSFCWREELKKCEEHMEQLQKDRDVVSNEIEEAQSQNNMWVRTEKALRFCL